MSAEPTPFAPFMPRGDETRRHGRVQCQMVACTLGDVIDLSASGMRIRARRRPPMKTGARFTMTLQTLGGPMSVACKLVWVTKRGFRRHEMGVQFVDLPGAVRAELSALARAASTNETIRPATEAARAA